MISYFHQSVEVKEIREGVSALFEILNSHLNYRVIDFLFMPMIKNFRIFDKS